MALRDTGKPALPTTPKVEYSAAEIGALAHLYRGEDYRSTVWRTRLDSTTNWAVVATGIALSATFSSAEASRTGRSDRHCVPSVRGPPLPVFQRLASTCSFTRDRFLRADDQRRRHSVRCGLGRVAGEGLLRSALPHQLRPCGWSAASPHIRLDLCDHSGAKLAEVIEPYLAQIAQFADAGPFTLSIALADLCCFVSRSLFAGLAWHRRINSKNPLAVAVAKAAIQSPCQRGPAVYPAHGSPAPSR